MTAPQTCDQASLLLMRRAIRETLDRLGPDAVWVRRQRALERAYPLRGKGTRATWAVWWREVALALETDDVPVVAEGTFELTADGVECGWCGRRGCLACMEQRRWHEALTRRGLLADALTLQAQDVGVLRDWLIDQGIEETS